MNLQNLVHIMQWHLLGLIWGNKFHALAPPGTHFPFIGTSIRAYCLVCFSMVSKILISTHPQARTVSQQNTDHQYVIQVMTLHTGPVIQKVTTGLSFVSVIHLGYSVLKLHLIVPAATCFCNFLPWHDDFIAAISLELLSTRRFNSCAIPMLSALWYDPWVRHMWVSSDHPCLQVCFRVFV
jgi:hypothetical protein